ncbi:MAG: aminoacetone oxidase family FAD-binding enzyme [Clostridia bacterium]|nr:aminoacetone oxidase family FAD-binding enzyme [Clostridia bacterium]
MKNQYKIAIVGGGASGMLCAVELLLDGVFSGNDIVILEKNDRVGKKLLATGNGQCNLCNENLRKEFYHGNKKFVQQTLQTIIQTDVCGYLSRMGLVLTTGKDGKVYPMSKQATAVLDVLRAFLYQKGCNIITSCGVKCIKKGKQGFVLQTEQGDFYANKTVLAFGGSAGKQFGTDGSSYSLATNFGHQLTELYPSLVQLKTSTNTIKGFKGLKETATVYAYDGESLVSQSTGDLLFTEFGVSGSTIFQVSSYLVNAKNPKIVISFAPELTPLQLEKVIQSRMEKSFIEREDLLSSIINKKIGQAIYRSDKEKSVKSLSYALKNFTLKITGTLGFNYAQVTKGGIKTDTICPKTYQSQLVDGLYIIGEALNVDGDCGGYNLAFAFASGIASAKNIKSNIKS